VDGSNSTMVTIQVSPAVTPGAYYAELDITSVYGLRFYGDFYANPVYENQYYYASSSMATIVVYVT